MARSRPTLKADERALVRAALVWGVPSRDEDFWGRFASRRAARLREELTWLYDRELAREELRQAHEAESRPDPKRVHPSWWARALKEESPAVQRLVARELSGAIGDEVRAAIGLPPEEFEADRPRDPIAAQWAWSLWAERLVGGEPPRDDDPPVVAALCRFEGRELTRLVRFVALAKQAYAPNILDAVESAPGPSPSARDQERLDAFRARWGDPDPKLARVARLDLAPAREPVWLGFITIGRLLAQAEPRRARWALQHVPYHIAKYLRSQMKQEQPLVPSPVLLEWEGRVLGLARDRLREEGGQA